MIEATKLAKAGFTYLGRPYSEMDCQAFVERCLRDCGLTINLPGSNAWYRKMTWVGTPEECKKRFGHIPPGAFLFILAQDGKEPAKYRKDGIGNASHIGIYTAARSGAIHSSASRGCVAESVFRGISIPGGWNRVGLWDRIYYDVAVSSVIGPFDQASPAPAAGKNTVISSPSAAGDQNKTQKKAKGDVPMITAKVTLPEGASGETVNVRKGPGKHYPIDFKVPVGSEIRIRKILDKWSLIEWNGSAGYMMSDYIRLTDTAGGAGSDSANDSSPILPPTQTAILEEAITDIEKQLAVIRAQLGLGIPAAEKG